MALRYFRSRQVSRSPSRSSSTESSVIDQYESPVGFIKRFVARWMPPDYNGDGPGPDAVEYYLNDLTKGDIEFDPQGMENGEEFQQQMRYLVAREEGDRSESESESEDEDVDMSDEGDEDEYMNEAGQSNTCRIKKEGCFGDLDIWEWYPDGDKEPIVFAGKEARNFPFFADYCVEGNLIRRLNATGCPNVVKVYDWMQLNTDQVDSYFQHHGYRFRMLFDLYEGGNVYDVFNFYRKHKIDVPEAFLWHVFHGIACAILYCANGRASEGVKPGWEEIVHRDAHSYNFFLDLPSEDGDELYPQVYLANFDLAYTLPNNDVRNFKEPFLRTDVPSWSICDVAPEILGQGKGKGNIFPINYKVDVYSLGRTIQYAMSKHTYEYYEVTRLFHLGVDAKYLPYSKHLIKLILACVDKDPSNRPDAYTLWQETKLHAEEWGARARNERAEAKRRGQQYYDRHVMFGVKVGDDLYDDQRERVDYLRANSFKQLNADLVREGKELVKRELSPFRREDEEEKLGKNRGRQSTPIKARGRKAKKVRRRGRGRR
ncbi:serine/threonine protein kinase [Polytolypa hystricis UAMH7299]|uniref:non-specific serine/threonine protein kinase n=1 Tax=Polytolypa hystricis (strain UAMH7299) TaxID=1447883 RepID=A0A2B7XNY6_POLH7|nr:serine/threonine protein kinase [Polytolypa hystricis UAMH7299]